MKILVVEDEPSVAGFLHRGLSEQSYAVDLAADGLLGLHPAQVASYTGAAGPERWRRKRLVPT